MNNIGSECFSSVVKDESLFESAHTVVHSRCVEEPFIQGLPVGCSSRHRNRLHLFFKLTQEIRIG
jgi:hypothetical protein